MKKLLGLFLLILTGHLYSQELETFGLDTLGIDTLSEEPPAHFIAVYTDYGLQLVPSISGYNFTTNPGFSFEYDRWLIGFSQTTFQGTVELFVVFPNVFELHYTLAM